MLTLFQHYDVYIFIKYIIRKNNGITFSQFFKFFDKTYHLWKPLYKFRLKMIETFFPKNSCFTILNRKLHINEIKKYREANRNKFPTTSFNTNNNNNSNNNILSIFSCCCCCCCSYNNPNVYDYDYEKYSLYTYHDFAKNLIRKYDNKFNNYTVHFRLKHLNNKTCNIIINEIDKMYAQFNALNSKGMNQNTSQMSICNSQNSTSSMSFSVVNRSEHQLLRKSILRESSKTRKLKYPKTSNFTDTHHLSIDPSLSCSFDAYAIRGTKLMTPINQNEISE